MEPGPSAAIYPGAAQTQHTLRVCRGPSNSFWSLPFPRYGQEYVVQALLPG